ncbi:hypothetical protein KIH39_22120 [Telmatocola sphagniphila]|uniref:Uncharacterized protein n=1 Tax=Telmatocola sphagniphila TaxID=1123043 RepID=A0A8E6B3I2_9BACT|nr:hypothetical protein [Telmatocola sphagniphila]QVL31515.1 hypothetical protein KIH39_22120 [Telmatocola sphagniphila]
MILKYQEKYDSPLSSLNKDKVNSSSLSWRVFLTEFMDLDIFSEFQMNSGWDSEKNYKLINKMPAVYATFSERNDFTSTSFILINIPKFDRQNSPPATRVQSSIIDQSIIVAYVPFIKEMWTQPSKYADSTELQNVISQSLTSGKHFDNIIVLQLNGEIYSLTAEQFNGRLLNQIANMKY